MTTPIPPERVPDLDWSADRAASFAATTAQTWADVLNGLEGDLELVAAETVRIGRILDAELRSAP